MQTTWHEALHTLAKGETLRIHGGEGASVVVFGGRIWLTQDGDLRDIHLEAGDSFTLDAAAPAYLQALAPAQVMFAQPPRVQAERGPRAELRRWLQDIVARLAGAQRFSVEHRPAAA